MEATGRGRIRDAPEGAHPAVHQRSVQSQYGSGHHGDRPGDPETVLPEE